MMSMDKLKGLSELEDSSMSMVKRPDDLEEDIDNQLIESIAVKPLDRLDNSQKKIRNSDSSGCNIMDSNLPSQRRYGNTSDLADEFMT